MAQRVVGLTGATLRARPLRLPDLRLGGECARRPDGGERTPAGSRRPRTSGGPAAPLYRDDDGRLLGSIQYGPRPLFPRAAELPAGPPVRRCSAGDVRLRRLAARRRGSSSRYFLAAIGEARDKGAGRSRRSRTATPRESRPTSGSSSIARSSRATSSPTSASGSCAPRDASSCFGSSVGGLRAGGGRQAGSACSGWSTEAFAPAPVPHASLNPPGRSLR